MLQEQPKRKARVSSKGQSLVDFLPAPKQDLSTISLGKAGSKVRCPAPCCTGPCVCSDNLYANVAESACQATQLTASLPPIFS